jgi:hypothetical protein
VSLLEKDLHLPGDMLTSVFSWYQHLCRRRDA